MFGTPPAERDECIYSSKKKVDKVSRAFLFKLLNVYSRNIALLQNGGDSAIAAAVQGPRGNSEPREGIPVFSPGGKYIKNKH